MRRIVDQLSFRVRVVVMLLVTLLAVLLITCLTWRRTAASQLSTRASRFRMSAASGLCMPGVALPFDP